LKSKVPGKLDKGEAIKVTPAELPDFAPLLQREACAAKLTYLEQLEQATLAEIAAGQAEMKQGFLNSGQYAEAAKRAAEYRKERLELSIKSRVLCPLTSLLVLESEADYQRFGIERTALADVVLIGKTGIELQKRGEADLPALTIKAPAPKPGERGKNAELRKSMAGKEEEKGNEADKGDPAKDGKSDSPGDYVAEDLKKLDDKLQGETTLSSGEPGNAEGGQDGEQRQQENERARVADFPGPDISISAPAATNAAPVANVQPQVSAPRDANARGDEGRPTAARRELTGAAGMKHPAPDWIAQHNRKPSELELETLRAQVAAQPRNRTLRNVYCDALFKAEKWDSLQGQCFEWMPFDPENPQVYEYLAKSATNLGDAKLALRAITSIAEIAPNRAALLARAGWLALAAKQHDMAAQMFREAMKNRTDDCNIYRGLSLALWLNGKLEDAAKVYCDALKVEFNPRYGDARRVLREELCYVVRALARDDQQAATRFVLQEKLGDAMLRADALRVTLCWETDASDVDLHVADPSNEVCFYSHNRNASGLELYSDQTQGLGPEVIRADKALKGTYHVAVNYFSAGAMGVSRGIVIVMQPKDGIVQQPQILPFCLVPGSEAMRHLAAATFE